MWMNINLIILNKVDIRIFILLNAKKLIQQC